MIPLVTLSLETCMAAMAVCFFVMGIVVDRTCIWFYNQYVAAQCEDEDESEEAI